MPITIDLPADTEAKLRERHPNLDQESREIIALDLFRREIINHHELSKMLGLTRMQTDRFLVEKNEYAQSLTLVDLEEDYERIQNFIPACQR